jgi:pyridoxal phosphate enzyme (YggS family)
MTIAHQIQQIRASLPSSVRLIAVTKQVSVEAMRVAYRQGIRDFAENRLQEALTKQEELKDLSDVTWHFIGHLQTNKARKVLEHFPSIQSLDSLKLAQRLNQLAQELAISPRVYLQVKPLQDPDKYGWSIPELIEDLPQLETCKSLKIQGLMTILPYGLSSTEQLKAFATVRDVRTILEEKSTLCLPELSMGMSGDYLLAVEAGATMVRLGQILFGSRPSL